MQRSEFLKQLKVFFLKHFLLFSEVIAVILAFAWPWLGAQLSHSITSLVIVGLIFLLTGLKIKTEELKSIPRYLDIVVIGCVSSLFITSLIPSSIANQLPYRSSSIAGENNTSNGWGPQELKLGIILFHCAPCTLATGIIMVTTSEGSTLIAVCISTICNLAGCFISPLLFSIFAPTGEIADSSVKIIIKLSCSILLPLIVGKLLALNAVIKSKVTAFKRCIGLLQNTGICLILWLKLSKSIYKGTFKLIRVQEVFILAAIVLGFHLLVLTINFIISITFCFKREHFSVALLLVSQKTIVLTTAIASAFPETLGDPALILLPCFIGHPLQTIMDSILIQPVKNTSLFPVCLPQFCRKYRGEGNVTSDNALSSLQSKSEEVLMKDQSPEC